MPRAGSGGSHSSSHRSSSRSSGGHRISSSRSSSHSRAGSRRSSSSSSSYRRSPSYHSAPPPPPSYRGPGMPPPPPSHRSGYRRRTYYRGSSGGPIASVIVIIIVLTIVMGLMSVFFSAISSRLSGLSRSAYSSSVPANTRNRERLNSGMSFDSNCIIDELGWFDSVSKTGTRLKTFYDKTGVQPYIVLLQYHPELTTDLQKEEYAQDYYEDHIDNESTFLYIYFAEEDQDNDVGYMCYVNGIQVDSVMDAEAVDIFWEYLDRNWYSGMSTDELFERAFTRTAEAIMP